MTGITYQLARKGIKRAQLLIDHDDASYTSCSCIQRLLPILDPSLNYKIEERKIDVLKQIKKTFSLSTFLIILNIQATVLRAVFLSFHFLHIPCCQHPNDHPVIYHHPPLSSYLTLIVVTLTRRRDKKQSISTMKTLKTAMITMMMVAMVGLWC